MDFLKSLTIAASGLKAQSGRMRIIAENIANADSAPSAVGAEPYRRKIPTFTQHIDRETGASMLEGRAGQARSLAVPHQIRSRQSQRRCAR